MKDKKTRIRMYFAWNYDKEIEDLNKLSKEGWQLTKGGCFHSTLKQDTAKVYRYQIDYNNLVEDKERYVETFADQGWEYINSTFNGWHYFKKEYDETKPEEEYQIYTDHQSKAEMMGRWIRVGSLFSALMTFIALWDAYETYKYAATGGRDIFIISRASIVLADLAIAALLGIGVLDMKRILSGKKKIHMFVPVLFTVVIVVSIVVNICIG